MGNSVSNSGDNQALPGDSKTRDSSTNPRVPGGRRKESHTACTDKALMMRECMEANSDYYHQLLAPYKSGHKVLRREFHAVFLPSSAGRDIAECEGDAKVEEEEVKFLDYMEGGPCKDLWTTVGLSGADEDKDKLYECMLAHSDYYHPMVKVVKAAEEHQEKEMDAFLTRLNEDSDQPKEGEYALDVVWSEFIQGGCCKESFMAFVKCVEEAAISEEEQSS